MLYLVFTIDLLRRHLLKVAIVDDFKSERYEIIHLVKDYFLNTFESHFVSLEFNEFESGESFLEKLIPNEYSLVFLDIYMSQMTGIETAEKLRLIDKSCNIIFFTNSTEHILDGYGVLALGYILKPISDNKTSLYKALDLFLEINNIGSTIITINTAFGKKQISTKNIVYIESVVRNLHFHFFSDSIKVSGKYIDYAPLLLEDQRFLEPYRNIVLNMDYIDKPLENDFLLKNGALIPISRRRKIETLEKYTNYLLKRRGY